MTRTMHVAACAGRARAQAQAWPSARCVALGPKRYTEKCNSANARKTRKEWRSYVALGPELARDKRARKLVATARVADAVSLGPLCSNALYRKMQFGKSVIPKNAVRETGKRAAQQCGYMALGPSVWPSARTRRHLPAPSPTAQVAERWPLAQSMALGPNAP